MNSSTAENLMRSAKAPTIRPQVMAAKAPWKATKMNSGTTTPLLKVAATESGVMPFRNSLSRLPKKALPSVKATL
jgi:hypothetical protein